MNEPLAEAWDQHAERMRRWEVVWRRQGVQFEPVAPIQTEIHAELAEFCEAKAQEARGEVGMPNPTPRLPHEPTPHDEFMDDYRSTLREKAENL